MTNSIDERLAGALALAVVQKPRANLQQIARQAGISKATLYRISPTREGLIKMLWDLSSAHMQRALQIADLDRPPFVSALERLTDAAMKGREFYLFWNSALWMDLNDSRQGEVHGYSPSFYSDTLEIFFLNGQKAGVFRIDMSAKWLAKAYDFLLYAAAESAQRGEIALVGMPAMVNMMFMQGGSASSANTHVTT